MSVSNSLTRRLSELRSPLPCDTTQARRGMCLNPFRPADIVRDRQSRSCPAREQFLQATKHSIIRHHTQRRSLSPKLLAHLLDLCGLRLTQVFMRKHKSCKSASCSRPVSSNVPEAVPTKLTHDIVLRLGFDHRRIL